MDSRITLSPREREIARLFAGGLQPGEIAPRVGITTPAVKKVLWSVRKKLNVQTGDGILRFIEENGLPEERRRDFQQDFGTSDPYTRLAAAVLLKAVGDIESQDPQVAGEAVIFMAGDGLELAEALGFNRDRVQQWIEQIPIMAMLLQVIQQKSGFDYNTP